MAVTSAPTDEAPLRHLLGVLAPYAEDFLLIGGWVPTLYARYGPAGVWATRTSRTFELDLVLPALGIPPASRPLIATILAGAGLAPDAYANASGGAAVWVGASDSGEKIEFLVPDTGPFSRRSSPRPVRHQPGVTAMPLVGVELLWRASRWLTLRGAPEQRVRVPSIGAYVLNKAITFSKRVPSFADGTNPKQGKDLVYLHDCALAGRPIIASVIEDVREACADDEHLSSSAPRMRDAVDIAIGNLEGIAAGRFARGMDHAATELAVRDAMSEVRARAEITGALDDLREVLTQFRSPPPSMLSN
jgi:hypothetical protein